MICFNIEKLIFKGWQDYTDGKSAGLNKPYDPQTFKGLPRGMNEQLIGEKALKNGMSCP